MLVVRGADFENRARCHLADEVRFGWPPVNFVLLQFPKFSVRFSRQAQKHAHLTQVGDK